VLPGRAGQLLRSAIEAAADALARGDADRLGALLPAGEHWRMLPAFGDGVLYLDIGTGDDDVRFEGISAIGMLDHHGPRLLLGGRDLQSFPEAAHGATMLVTFNGLSFDVPILRRAFPDWRRPFAMSISPRATPPWPRGRPQVDRAVADSPPAGAS
jgi:uncharacterized protein